VSFGPRFRIAGGRTLMWQEGGPEGWKIVLATNLGNGISHLKLVNFFYAIYILYYIIYDTRLTQVLPSCTRSASAVPPTTQCLRRRDLIYTPYTQRLRLICHSFARVPPQPSPPPTRLRCPLVILYLERGFQNASDPAATAAGPADAASATGCIEERCIPREGQIPLEQKNLKIKTRNWK